MESYDSVCRIEEEGVKKMDLFNVLKNDATASNEQVLDKDGVHLTPSASKVFLDDKIFYCEEFFYTLPAV